MQLIQFIGPSCLSGWRKKSSTSCLGGNFPDSPWTSGLPVHEGTGRRQDPQCRQEGSWGKVDKHLLPWGSLPRMRVAGVVSWRIHVNKFIGVEIHRILAKSMIHSWNGTWFLGTQWCCCQRLGLLAKLLKCWTLAGLDGKNKHRVKEILGSGIPSNAAA